MTPAKLQSNLGSVLTLLLECPGALRVIIGGLQAPGPDELSLIASKKKTVARKLMKRPGAAMDTPLGEIISETIESAGGWPNIIKASREWIRNNPDTWEILIDYFLWGKVRATMRIDGNVLGKIAKERCISQDVLIRLVKSFPDMLAGAILKKPA